MNKTLIIKQKALHTKISSISYTISQIASILENESFYQKPESITALKELKSI